MIKLIKYIIITSFIVRSILIFLFIQTKLKKFKVTYIYIDVQNIIIDTNPNNIKYNEENIAKPTHIINSIKKSSIKGKSILNNTNPIKNDPQILYPKKVINNKNTRNP